MNNLPEASYGRRAASYWFADGIPELELGLMMLATAGAGALWLGAYRPDLQFAYTLSLMCGFMLHAIFGRRVIEYLKSRITYPRTGYAQPPEENDAPTFKTLTSLELQPAAAPNENVTSFNRRTSMVVFFLLITPIPHAPRWFISVLLPALAVLLYFTNRRSEHPYPWWSVLSLGLLGLMPLLVPLPPSTLPWAPILLVGAWLTAQGGLRLAAYLRKNPKSRAGAEVRA